jgi:hypothetical protein
LEWLCVNYTQDKFMEMKPYLMFACLFVESKREKYCARRSELVFEQDLYGQSAVHK